MCAALIFALARAIRRAIVVSCIRKARAISGTVRPPSRRRVSATRASIASAGWQQVKTSLSRSSSTGPVGSGGVSSYTIRAAWCLASRCDSRRSQSIALRVAVVASQPPGLGGTPSRGHRSVAATNASAVASSATSRSPKRRARPATTRAHSWWWARVIACSTVGPVTALATAGQTPRFGTWAPHSLFPGAVTPGLPGTSEPVYLLRPVEHGREPAGPVPRRLIVGHVHDGEAAEVLLGLDVRAVGEDGLAVNRLDTAHRGGPVETTVGEDQDTFSQHLLDHRTDGLALLTQLVRRMVGHPLIVEGDQVLRHGLLLLVPGRGPFPTPRVRPPVGRRTLVPRTAAP